MNMRLTWLFRFALICAALVLGEAYVAFGETSRYSTHITPASISPEMRNAFFNAFINGASLNVPREQPSSKDSNPQFKDYWIGNKPDLQASLDSVELTFEGPAAKEGEAKETFVLGIEFKEVGHRKVAVFKTSRSETLTKGGGIMMLLEGDKVRRILLRAHKKSSLVVTLPETTNIGLKGVLICPSEIVQSVEKDKNTNIDIKTVELRETGFYPVSARLAVRAAVKGKLLGGILPGFARANISTSKEIPNAELHYDEAFSRNPRIDVIYQGGAITPPIPLGPERKLLQGLSLQLELQNSAGYQRASTLSEVLEIFPVDRDFEFTVVARKREFKMNGRSCYALLRTSSLTNDYSKSELGNWGQFRPSPFNR